MAIKTKASPTQPLARKAPNQKRTSIGHSNNSRPKSKHKTKPYRGQGK